MSDNQEGRTETQNGEGSEKSSEPIAVLQAERQILKTKQKKYSH